MAQRKIDVVKVKRKKGARKKVTRKRKKVTRKKKRAVLGAGSFSTGVPTNRVIDSNQYWQLRAEIAGGEAKVRTTIKDRQEAEDKKDEELRKLRIQVGALQGETRATSATANAALFAASVGTPAAPVGTPATPASRAPRRHSSTPSPVRGGAWSDDEYDTGNAASEQRGAPPPPPRQSATTGFRRQPTTSQPRVDELTPRTAGRSDFRARKAKVKKRQGVYDTDGGDGMMMSQARLAAQERNSLIFRRDPGNASFERPARDTSPETDYQLRFTTSASSRDRSVTNPLNQVSDDSGDD